MRRKPVTRSEIRFDGSRITTLPVDAVRIVSDRDFSWREYIVAIPGLWAPLLFELTEWRKRDKEQWHHFYNAIERANGLPLRSWKPPEPVSLPERYAVARYRGGVSLGTCQHWGANSIASNGRYCSDDCAKASWRDARAGSVAAMVKVCSEVRAAARADRHCAKPRVQQAAASAAVRHEILFRAVSCRCAPGAAESNRV